MDISKRMEKIQPDMVRWRRALHQMPEVGLELPKTVEYICSELEQMGVEYHRLMEGRAIVGILRGKKEGKTIALRADIDALPVAEQTGLAFASQNGNMHACGHDAHAAMLLGAAKALKRMESDWQGTVKLIFQPAEEYPGGALPMIEEGVLDHPAVDAILALHNGNINPLVKKGKIGICYGPMMASMDKIKIIVQGKGAHGAYPELAIDPIVIAANIIMALQTIVSRGVKATDEAVVSICRIQGGYNQNIIPDQVELEGTVRATSSETRAFLSRRIKEICRDIASAHGGSCELNYETLYPPLINDRRFTEFFRKSALKLVQESDILVLDKPVMGGEDMAFFLEKVPGTFFFLSNPNPVNGECYPHHSAKFDVDESYFKLGAGLMVQTVMDFLNG